MGMSAKIVQEYEALVDWEKLSKDIKERFNIDADVEEIEEFLRSNEDKYLDLVTYEQDLYEKRFNDLTGEETEETT